MISDQSMLRHDAQISGLGARLSDFRLLGSGFRSRQSLRQQMQIALAITKSFERAYGFQHIVAISSGLTVALPHVMQTFCQRQSAGILHVAAIADVAHRPHAAPRVLFELDLPHGFDIDRRDRK